MNYYISDLHFGHRAVLDFDQRPFFDVQEMDRVLIYSWNNRVTKNDQVYILGDFAFKNEEPFSWYLKQLAGQKHLIIGNHDKKLLKDEEAMGYFVSVDYQLAVTDNQKHLILSHFPFAEWDGFYRDVYHIYGHIHNKRNDAFQHMRKYETALNAGCMINNYCPVSFKELIWNNQIFKEGGD